MLAYIVVIISGELQIFKKVVGQRIGKIASVKLKAEKLYIYCQYLNMAKEEARFSLTMTQIQVRR